MQIIGRDGKVLNVSQTMAEKYIASGYFRPYAGPAKTELHTGLVEDPNSPTGYSPTTEIYAGTDSRSIYEGTSRYTGSGIHQREGAGPQTPSGAGDLPQHYRSKLTPVEQDKVDAYWKLIEEQNGGNTWFAIETIQLEDGTWVEFRDPEIQNFSAIEDLEQQEGWNDQMVDALLTLYRDSSTRPEDYDPAAEGLYGDDRGGGGGGGGGGGPKYVSPMREVVEDTVKALLTSLTGDESEERIGELTDEFLRAHKNSWDIRRSGGEDILPEQVVIESIRKQDDYKRIHAQRGESDSEQGWIRDRANRLSLMGMGSKDADDRAVRLAQQGTSLSEIDIGAAQNAKGIKDVSLFNNIKKQASTLARLI